MSRNGQNKESVTDAGEMEINEPNLKEMEMDQEFKTAMLRKPSELQENTEATPKFIREI